MQLTKQELDRLWSKVRKSRGCWKWAGSKLRRGYGMFSLRGKMVYAHRLVYQIVKGVQLTPDQLCCHRCDNPNCVNPAHIFLGTHLDNARDRCAKGRTRTGHLYGEANKLAKLTTAIVREMRRRHANGESARSLAKRFKVSSVKARSVVNRTSWRHVS